MKIRDAIPSDFEFLIAGLEENRLIEKRPAADIKATQPDKVGFRSAIKNKRIRIAEQDGRPVGFLYYKADFHVMYINKKFFWVDLIFVKKQFRKQGIGKLLYKDVIALARKKGYKSIAIDVFEKNINSRRFHLGLDFQPIYTIYEKKI